MRATTRDRPPYRAVTAIGTAAEVHQFLATATRIGTLVRAAEPEPTPGGMWRIKAVLWTTARPADPVRIQPPALPPPRRPAARPSRQAGDHASRVAAWTGVAAVLAAVLWIIWQAVSTAVEWTTDHTGQLIAGTVLVALAGIAWLRWRLRKPACPGHTHHCSGCRSH